MSEFIGYVGTLFEIDSEKSTVALERVVSHGTEGRCANPQDEIPGTEQVYDFIVFRGSDVKDLRIETGEESKAPPPPQVPDDPAILGTSAPARLNYPPPPLQYPPHFNPQGPMPSGQFGQGYPPMGPAGFYGQYGQNRYFGQPPPYMGYPPMPPGPPGPNGQFGMPLQNPQGRGMPQAMPSTPVPIGPAQGRGNAQANARTGQASSSPTKPSTSQPTASANAQKPAVPVNPSKPPPPPLESKPDIATALAPPPTISAPERSGARTPVKIVPAVPAVSPRPPVAQVAQPIVAPSQGAPQPASASTTTTTAKTPSAVEELKNKVQDMKLSNGNAAPHHPRQHPGTGGYVANRGNRGRGAFRGGFNANQQQHKIEVPAQDYDFESANARFTKVAEPTVTKVESNGTPAESVTSNGEKEDTTTTITTTTTKEITDVVIPQADSFYKKSSFFDNISCENKDRAESKEGERPRGGAVWRGEEVKKNIETFGQGSVDSGYGRRGWGRGRGRGHGGRGGQGHRGRGGNNRGISNAGSQTGVQAPQ